jgi:hypothetical protein
MRKTLGVLIVVMTMGLWFVPRAAEAQEGSKETSPAEPAKPKLVQPLQSYRLDFSFNEVADGKTVNTRHYSMNLTAGNSDEIKIGTRVPVATRSTGPSTPAPTEYQYLDIGTQIWSQLREHGDELILVVRGEVSNLDVDTGQHTGAFLPPVVRQIKINGDTLLVVGKPIVIGSVDDPNSKKQFQLEVTVTKLK